MLLIFVLLCIFSLTGCSQKKEILSKVNIFDITPSECIEEYYANNKLVTIHKYYEMSDSTWRTDNNTYKYRLEISGRMNGASKNSTFVFLSNLDETSFEQAWKASGFSSNMNDYFNEEDAFLVAMK